MKLFEDPIFKNKYMKNKRRVKRWESDFMEKYGRKPNKNDIKEADISIKEAYKIYWKLKTRALEETLTDITFCDDMQDNVTNSLQKSMSDQEKILSPEKNTKDAENIDPHNSKHFIELEDPLSQLNKSADVEGVWGDHLSKSKEQIPKKKQALLIGRSSSFQLSKNKFESSTFTKRNPRKSLSSTKIRNKVENDTSSNIDQTAVCDKDGFDVAADEIKSMFDESMKLTFKESKPTTQYSINAVQQLVDSQVTCVNRNLNGGWLDRCTIAINSQRFSGSSDSGVESTESSIYSTKSSTASSATLLQVSDEDFICNSDSEEECRKKRIRNFKKELSEQDNIHPAKRQCIKIDFDTTQSNDIIDNDTFKQICHVNKNLNLIHKSNKNENDNINASKLINDLKTSFNILDKSIRIQNNINHSDSNVINKETSENNCKTDQVENRFRITDAISKSADLANQEDSLVSNEESVKQHISRRRAKQVPSEDSNSNVEEKDKKAKVKTRSVKKSISRRGKDKTASNEEKCNMKGRRKSSRKDTNLEKNDKDQNSDSEIYDIPACDDAKMLQTIPRFAMKPSKSSDLVVQLSESLSNDAQERDASTLSTSTKSTAIAKLEQKMATGTMNNNFVRINLKKKVFVRGKKNFNLSKYKRNQWKHRKKSSANDLDAADLIDKNGMTCFKCGESGHFAKNCTTSVALLPLSEIDESINFPTLEEVEKMAGKNAQGRRIDGLPEGSLNFAAKASCSSQEHEEEEEEDMMKLFDDDFDFNEKEAFISHKIPQELCSRLLPPRREVVDPLYSTNKDNSLIETPEEVFEALRTFGHKSFRSGQEKAIMRILSGQSTLVKLSTGSGKSLCYQLPAYLYSKRFPCITLVISPLVSLMDDQVTGMPAFLSAACLHTNQTPKVREQVMESVRQGRVNILLVSPEAVVAGEKSTGFGALLNQLPPIAFACIDEVHCISQWSHNFRPSYLMVCRVLKEKLRVRMILGLTATVTKTTAESIVKHLNLHDGMTGIISDLPLPRNLVLTMSKDENKDQALIALLKSERFRDLDSVIVYCIRREECARIAGLLRVSLQDPRNPENPKARISTIAEAYHAGMTTYKRKLVQKEFMSSKIRIVVATVAFGMGINKSDIRAIIHYNMPATFEGYVQEVGRSGRDNITAHCHLFLNSVQNSDKWELRRHIHANGVDRHTIRRLLQKIFIPCSCAKINTKSPDQKCSGHEVALPIDEITQELDITQETIATLLCYLELHPKSFITVLSSVYVRARISSYHGPQALKQAAQSSLPLAMAIALDMQRGISHEDSNLIEFSVIEVASAIGWDSGVVKSHLKNLEWITGTDGKTKRSAISVKYDKLGLRVKAPGDLTDAELDEALDELIARTRFQETSCLQQLELISSTFDKISVPRIEHCSILTDDVLRRSEELKNIIREYFLADSPLNNVDISLQNEVTNEQQIATDVRNLIICYRDTKFTGRAIARIFHGIQSPNYSAVIWSRCRFWRTHLAADFNVICKIATREILALR
ncbi:ATP-dependent DNA helicase Q4 [Nylanderia fulva]|uniref:ATP-dependent DNA helicase Q4 n=1 Tax=Nylanderia fulva TaxID=613905 RepID=UPI0010FB092F|nr:ATP-dependent DNA helicase Q4 [Nylanderia fulva]